MNNLTLSRLNNLGHTFERCRFIIFSQSSYDEIEIKPNSIIYCDIPYKGTAKYASGDFDYDKFYAWCKEMAKTNIVLVSEYWMPEDGFKCVWQGNLKCTLDKASRSDKIERLYLCNG